LKILLSLDDNYSAYIASDGLCILRVKISGMKKSLLTLAGLIFIFISVNSQSFSGFIEYVNSLPEEDRTAVIDSFMTATEPLGFPYLTGDSANFIYRGEVTNVRIAGDFNGWDPGFYYMANISGTDFFYRSRTFELNARLDYKYVINGSTWILDPLNPNTCSGGFGPNSELAMPAYVQPWEIESYTGTPEGTIIEDQIASSNTGSTFHLQIYLPAGYNENLPGGYPVVYFQDGHEYISLGFADNVLDNLIDSNLCSPVIAVFVRPNNRNEEYAGSLRNQYRLFFAEELVPYIDENYNTIREARGRAVLGDSFGGNISALISYNHPEIFGNCGLHSGAFWPNEFEAFYLIVQGDAKPIRWSSVWGTYEGLWESMRAFRDSLLTFGYEFTWLELPEGHSWGLWRATIDEMVPFFFPPEFMETGELVKPEKGKILCHPNPAEDYITCVFNLSSFSHTTLKLYSISGQKVYQASSTLNKGEQRIDVDLSNLLPGIYFVDIIAGKERYTERLVVH
jgi:enterochelin esterase family protein